MKKFWVYVHTCNVNGKRYVGITTASKPEIRWGKNGEGYKGQLFGKAVRKYGWSSITHEVFEVDSEEEMYRKEIELISFYHSNDPEYGYNCSTGGEKSASGCTRSEEYRKKMSETKKGQHHSEESRKKMSEVHKEKWLDPEYREKISKALKGKPNPHSEEHKRHIAEAKKGKPCSEETRKKISETINKRNSDPEFRRKMSEAQKKVHSDPEYRKHMSEVLKGKPHKPLSEETKRRMSEARKGKPQPKIKIQLPDGTIIEITKQLLARDYVNKGRKFEYVS